MTELRLIRTLERIDVLKGEGRWSFRQPKKQRGVGGLNKTHWDYLMDEMVKSTISAIFKFCSHPHTLLHVEMDAHRFQRGAQVEDDDRLHFS